MHFPDHFEITQQSCDAEAVIAPSELRRCALHAAVEGDPVAELVYPHRLTGPAFQAEMALTIT